MLKNINLKEFSPTVDYALAVVEIEIERAKFDGTVAIKVLHGYGSHGKGGAILSALRKRLRSLKKGGIIKDFFSGDKWNIFDKDTLSALNRDKSIYGDEDLNKSNPGITIIIL